MVKGKGIKVCVKWSYVTSFVDNPVNSFFRSTISTFLFWAAFNTVDKFARHDVFMKAASSDVETIHTVTSQNANNLFE